LQKRREVRAHGAVDDGVLGGAPTIGVDRRGRCASPIVPRRRRERRHRIRIVAGAPSRDPYE